MNNVESLAPELNLNPDSQRVSVNDLTPSISVQWDRTVQETVVNSFPGSTIASLAYGILHTAMFDAWAAYDEEAIATQSGDDLQRPKAEITQANKEEAMSFAAYHVLTELFPDQTEMFDELMTKVGFGLNNTTMDTQIYTNGRSGSDFFSGLIYLYYPYSIFCPS